MASAVPAAMPAAIYQPFCRSEPTRDVTDKPVETTACHIRYGCSGKRAHACADQETGRAANGKTDLAASLGTRLAGIPALTAVGAAAILAETGGPRRYDGSSSLVKHAGLSPSGNASGAFSGEAHISRRGRPGLRLTVWRAVWPMLQFNPVMAAKYQAMTQPAETAAMAADAGSRQATAAARARRAKARAACAASLLRWIYSMVVHGTSWDPAAASATAGRQHAPRPVQAA